jgi:hypothetical protein
MISPKASRLLLRTALELGTAGGAKVATVMGHARPDTANVRDVLLAEPHRVRFTGRTLLRGPLLRGGGPRRHHEREAQQHRSRGFHRPELLLGATKSIIALHLVSDLVSTVNSTDRGLMLCAPIPYALRSDGLIRTNDAINAMTLEQLRTGIL